MSTTEPTVSLGTMIRSRRLGWGLSRRHGAFVRMSDAGTNRTLVELCPIEGVPAKKCPGGFHRCWWDSPELLDMIPWLRGVRRVKKYVAVVIDDEGAIL